MNQATHSSVQLYSSHLNEKPEVILRLLFDSATFQSINLTDRFSPCVILRAMSRREHSYLNKKKTAEEMEQHYQQTSSVDYSLKEGKTLVLQIKKPTGGRTVESTFFEQGLNSLSLDEKANRKESMICLKPPPPPPAPLSPVKTFQSSPNVPSHCSFEGNNNKDEVLHSTEDQSKGSSSHENQTSQHIPEDDFGDFQTAG
ncbi:hypothetical protein NE237_002106 [Protea cynaroides]|uniref:Uncharacterized protein n=1 Tax=Protea cynaroides TaxID=273540 RepID=A0A9Q0KUK9_9MAGN|nr:hypothetical protein NE237_002106 [Protea cynaroides]